MRNPWLHGIGESLPCSLGWGVCLFAALMFCFGLKCYATTDSGTLWSLGYDVPEGFTNIMAVGADSSRVVVLRDDSTVNIWSTSIDEEPPIGLSNVTAVAAAYGRVVSLQGNGIVREWVPRSYGGSYLSGVPADLTNAIAIAAGNGFALALRSNGMVVAWGTNSYVTNVPAGLTDIVAIAAGDSHALALTRNGTVRGWGRNQFGQTNPPTGMSNVTLIAAGANTCLAANAEGYVWRWGERSSLAVPQNPWGDLTQIAVNTSRNMLLHRDGTVSAWGTGLSTTAPIVLPAHLTNVLGIGVGSSSVYAIVAGPVLRLEPVSATNVLLGGTHWAFKTFAEARDPFVYQWFLNGTPLAGATNPLLRFIGISPSDSGTYFVTVSNAFGSTTSTQATLNAIPFRIMAQPTSVSAQLGHEASFRIFLDSVPPVQYQWFRDGTIRIAGGTNSALTLLDLQNSDAGGYSVLVSNIYGVAWSSNANLRITGPGWVVDNAYVVKSAGASNVLSFALRITSGESPESFSLRYQTRDGTARSNIDYVTVSGSVTFPPGTTNAWVDVPILGTTNYNPQWMVLEVCRTNPAPFTCASASGWILAPGFIPLLTVSTSGALEGSGTNVATIRAVLSGPPANSISFQWATRDGTARSGRDYVAAAGSVVFPPGNTNQTFSVRVTGDLFKGSNRVFYVNLSNVSGATVTNSQLGVTISDDDGVSITAGFTQEVVADSLTDPTAMAFAPDGRLFYCEQGGRVRVIKNGVRLPTPFLQVATTSVYVAEDGLLGIAFDPGFTNNQFLYVYYTVPEPDRHNRVSRFTADGDIVLSGSEQVILEIDGKTNSYIHQGGTIHFGPDSKLYVAVGDHGLGTRSNAQALNSHFGKILRVNSDGSMPEDNPFYAVASGPYRAIWALGLRNPFTFAVHPQTGRMLINDVGDNWEEINEAQPGANYGWPYAEGPSPTYQNPVHYYQTHGPDGCAVIGATFYTSAHRRFPRAYVDNYFFGDLCRGSIRRLTADGLIHNFVTNGVDEVVDLDIGPDGALYCLARRSSNPARIYRFAPASRFTSVQYLADNRIHLRAVAAAEQSYILEASRNLLEWEAIATNSAATLEIDFYDTIRTDQPQRFYRLTE